MVLTLEDVKARLRIDEDDEDEVIEQLIGEAQSAAEDYCRVEFGDGDCPKSVKLAVMLYVSHYYQNRDVYDRLTYVTMMNAFKNLLYPYRDVDKMF